MSKQMMSKILIKKVMERYGEYLICDAQPATGIIYIINDFLSGHVRLRGKGNGAYPYRYLDMIDALFGPAHCAVEACSGTVGLNHHAFFRVDINKNENVTMRDDAQQLSMIEDNFCDRWRCDPPYNARTASRMYHCEMPNLYKLLEAGARVVKPGSLLFLLCAQNYQRCPPNVERIGVITITVVPNNELRACNIYRKLSK